ncbi:hypothetical protein SACS_0355 [Parasaccharibacter apium]|uniref:Uncharacterized protein n=1 Tax=Parasaccharibacter apium TaxID=1510841 RepID=A0A7U7G4P7_9PROT|nr:hypothetical protein SACS_0355 [Parasaccharibacter apium]
MRSFREEMSVAVMGQDLSCNAPHEAKKHKLAGWKDDVRSAVE